MFSIWIKSFIFLVQCLIFCSHKKFVLAIMGPNVRQANPNEFSAVVSIMIKRNLTHSRIEMNHKCTGTLISRQDVVTAEHCIRTTFTEGFQVMVGSSDLYQATKFFPMFIWTYEHWMIYRQRTIELTEHDIAFIKLMKNIPSHIQYAPVGNIDSENLWGLNAVIAGWGRLENNTRPRILNTGEVHILSKQECENRIYAIDQSYNEVDPRFMCSVADPYVVLKEGDSGGPVFLCGTLVAVSKGVCPIHDGPVLPHHLNFHLGIRYYYEFYQDIITTFHVNF